MNLHQPDDYVHDIEELSSQLKVVKGNIKRRLVDFGFEKNKDYIIRYLQKSQGNYGGHNKESIFLTSKCYQQLLAYFCLNKRKTLGQTEIAVQYVKRYLPKEIEILHFIREVLGGLYTIDLQHRVLQYRVDMYIMDKNIVVECDELGHEDRDVEYENHREKEIIQFYKCKFIRFNPDDPDFKLSTLMNIILKELTL
jgi:very-short-patch-repair endonuclease